jgi:hypothetical protein
VYDRRVIEPQRAPEEIRDDGTAEASPPSSPLDEPLAPGPDPEIARLHGEIGRGIGWLYWAIGLSIFNVIAIAFGSDLTFALALVFAMIPTLLARQIASEAGMQWITAIGVVLAAFPIGLLYLLVRLAKAGRPWAFLAVMVYYAADTAIFAVAEDWLSVGLHALCLYFVFRAWRASSALAAKQRAALGDPLE